MTWLRAHGARSVAMVGASVGATLALFTAERPDLHIAAVVSLSGSAYDPWGIDVSAAGARAPKRVLLIAGADNGVDVSSTDFLKQVIPHARLVTVASGHHGAALLPDPAPNGGSVADLVTAFVLA